MDGRRARGDITRARVLDAAVESASRNGLNGVTIGQLAAAAGISKGHVALLFGSREKLQLATLDAAIAIFTEKIAKPAASATTASERLRRYCLGWFDYVHERVLPGGCLITAATSEFRTIDGQVRSRLIELRNRRRDGLRNNLLAALEEKGRIRGEEEIDDFVYQILAYQAAANVAHLLDDSTAFVHAKRHTEVLLDTQLGSSAP